MTPVATPEVCGVLVVDKPAGPTSHDVVTIVRRALGGVKTGHTGTLDPAATGVLPLVVGRATRLAQFAAASSKEYVARIRLGAATDTYDATGAVTFEAGAAAVDTALSGLSDAIAAFRGRFAQTPPPYSAKKTGGVRAYKQARRGEAVTLPAVEVEVVALDVTEVESPELELRLVSSPGFYVRSLAHDLGARLGVGGHLVGLRRTRSGPFSLEQAVPLDAVVREGPGIGRHLLPPDSLLPGMPAVRLTSAGMRRAATGLDLDAGSLEDAAPPGEGLLRLLGPGGGLVGLARPTGRGTLHPAVVLV